MGFTGTGVAGADAGVAFRKGLLPVVLRATCLGGGASSSLEESVDTLDEAGPLLRSPRRLRPARVGSGGTDLGASVRG